VHLFLFLITAVITVVVIVTAIHIMRVAYRHKGIAGEAHFFEYAAGVSVCHGGGISFGKHKLCRRYHKLNLSFHTDHREYAQRNVYALGTQAFLKAAVKALSYYLGYAVAGETAMTEGAAFFHKLGIEAYGVGNLNHYRGKRTFGVASHTIGIGAKIVVGGVGFEYRNILFAAEEYYLFVVSGNAFHFYGSAVSYADLQFDAEVVSYGYVVKTAVKGYLFYGYAGGYNIYAFRSHCRSVIYYVLHRVGKLNLKVLKAVFITGRIEYSVYTYANLLTLAYTGIISFNHYYSS